MKKSIIVGVITLCLLVTGCTTGQNVASLEGMPSNTPVQTIQLQGKDCTWTPDLIRVEKDTHVVLKVKSLDWDYNFQLPGYNLRFTIPEGQMVTSEFYAWKPGTYEFGCYIEQGRNYMWGGMVGKLIVE